MVQVLQPGNWDKVTCLGCDSLLKFEARDVTISAEKWDNRPGSDGTDTYREATIQCPQCKSTVSVEGKMCRKTLADSIKLRESRSYDDL